MQLKQKEFTVKCIKGNIAQVACASLNCNSSSLMCVNKLCQCTKLHSDCEVEVSLNKLQSKFQGKHLSTKSLLSEIYSWYENHAKLIAIEMESLKTLIDLQQFRLFGEEERLYSYLVEGRSDLVTPSLVANVQKTLYGKDSNNDIKINEEIKKQIEQQDKSLKKIFENVRKLVEGKITQNRVLVDLDFKFSHQLHHPNLTLIDNKTLKATAYASFGGAVLEPSLTANDYSSYKIKFKINNAIGSEFMFGVCQLTPNFKITQPSIYTKITHGSLTYYNNSLYLGNSGGHSRQSHNITNYSLNDEVSVEYWRDTQKVEVRNITKNTHSVSKISLDKSLPLYFAIILHYAGDEVEIMESQCK